MYDKETEMSKAMMRLFNGVLVAVVVFLGLGACASHNDLVSVSGEIMYRERIALPDDAVIKVQLKDVSLQDTKAIVMAEMTSDEVTTPHAFTFELARDQFQQGHTYAVGARIEVEGKLWFINTQSYVVDINSNEAINLIVNKVGNE